MQKINIRRQLRKAVLGAIVLGAGAFAGFPQRANAAARDVKEARKDVKEAQRDVRRADTGSERRDAREDLRDARHDRRDARQDLRREKREDRRDKDNRNNHWDNDRNNNRWDNDRRYDYNRGQIFDSGNFNWNNRSHVYGTYTGVVTRFSSSRNSEVRANGQSFDVYTDAGLPRGMDRGDMVRVHGVRSGGNDIRNASVSLIDHR